MEDMKNEIMDANVTDVEILQMMDETSQLIAQNTVDRLGGAAVAAQNSNALTNEVEFWKWMSRNWDKSGIFDSVDSMQQYINQGITKEEWFTNQIQGKGYEWDWIQKQRGDVKNIFRIYDAGDVVNRVGSDVTEKNIITGNTKEYQMKAYTSKTIPDLKNTPKDMVVVTNAEKVGVVEGKGYNNVESFQDGDLIEQVRSDRVQQVKDGTAKTTYSFSNVAGTMVKAGLFGCVIGMGMETICSYKAWKAGQISNDEYLKEILKAGGDSGLTACGTAGIMIPVSEAIISIGASTLISIPIAFVISIGVNEIVAPCFGRGKYKQYLTGAKYYQNLEKVYFDLLDSMQLAADQYYYFVNSMAQQNSFHQDMKCKSMELNGYLKDIYDSI